MFGEQQRCLIPQVHLAQVLDQVRGDGEEQIAAGVLGVHVLIGGFLAKLDDDGFTLFGLQIGSQRAGRREGPRFHGRAQHGEDTGCGRRRDPLLLQLHRGGHGGRFQTVIVEVGLGVERLEPFFGLEAAQHAEQLIGADEVGQVLVGLFAAFLDHPTA